LYQQVARLPNELQLTLEAYLGNGGNTVQAARQLNIHRNTMRQRMDKIRSLLDVDPADPQQWLYLQLAIMVTRSGKDELDHHGRATLRG
jgi:DNA-binding PucR family transcriptional regulator